MQSNDAAIVRGAAIPTAAVGVLAVAIGAVVAGVDGAVGVALGVLLAALFFGGGLLTLGYVGRRWPELFFGAAFMTYTTQMVLLVVALLLLRDASFLNPRAFIIGVVVGTVAWLGGQVRAHVRIKSPYVVPESTGSSPGGRP
ncbi:hypothetical protein [Streptomyces mayteni]